MIGLEGGGYRTMYVTGNATKTNDMYDSLRCTVYCGGGQPWHASTEVSVV